MGKANCEFRGTGGQYFPTVFIHVFLISAITFSLYLPWAWVRLFKLKASHTVISGKKVTFTGTGGQLFVLALINGLLTIITLGIYGPWAICKILDWRAGNTLVAGKPGQFVGTGGSLFLFYLIHLFILPMLTLGIYYFFAMYRFYAWKEEHTRYGGEKTSFGAGFGAFIKISIIMFILNLITLNLATPWTLCMLYRWQIGGLAVGDGKGVDHFPPVKTNFVVVAILVIIGMTFLVSIGFLFKTQFQKYSAAKVTLVKNIKKGAITGGKLIRYPVKRKVEKPVMKRAARKKAPASGLQSQAKILKRMNLERDKEIKVLSEVIKVNDKNADALYNRAWLYASKGNFDQAVRDYTRCIEINNGNKDAYYNRGLVYVRMSKYGLAIEDFSEVIIQDPRAVNAYCNRGNANFQLGKYDFALKDYSAALKIGPNDADIYYNMGMVYLKKGPNSRAMIELNKAAKMGHKKAREYLKQTPTKREISNRESKTSHAIWSMDLSNVKIPTMIASGKIHGQNFSVETSKVENSMLTLRQGKDFFPDYELMIFLFLKKGEKPGGKTYNITKSSGFGSPHIHMKWKSKTGKSKIPKTKIFTKGYAMRLNFGTKKDGKLAGKIYLCLPDEARSFVAGSFEAVSK